MGTGRTECSFHCDVERSIQSQHLQLLLCHWSCSYKNKVHQGHAAILVRENVGQRPRQTFSEGKGRFPPGLQTYRHFHPGIPGEGISPSAQSNVRNHSTMIIILKVLAKMPCFQSHALVNKRPGSIGVAQTLSKFSEEQQFVILGVIIA